MDEYHTFGKCVFDTVTYISRSSDFSSFIFCSEKHFSFIGKAQFRRASLSCYSSYYYYKYSLSLLFQLNGLCFICTLPEWHFIAQSLSCPYISKILLEGMYSPNIHMYLIYIMECVHPSVHLNYYFYIIKVINLSYHLSANLCCFKIIIIV